MKLIVSKTAIESAANILSKVIAARNTLPILGSLLCEVEGNELRMTASDTQVRMSVPVTLESADGDGRFCIMGQSLTAALGQLSEQPLEIVAEGKVFTIRHSSGERYFPLESAEEYPVAVAEQYIETLEVISGDQLRETLKRTLWAASRDEIRLATSGVNFALNNGRLEVVASDGKVLVLSSHDLAGAVKADRAGSFIMPVKAAKILADVMAGEVSIEWNTAWAHVKSCQYDISFRLIDAKYPMYHKVIPQGSPVTATMTRVDIINALRRVLPFATDNVSSRIVRLAFGGNKLKLTSENINYAMGARDEIAAGFDHPDLTIGVNGVSLLTMVSKLDGEGVEMRLSAPNRPIVIVPQQQTDKTDILMLAMPVLLGE